MIEIKLPEAERDNTVTEHKCPCIGINVYDESEVKFITFSYSIFHFTDRRGETTNSNDQNYVKNAYKLAPRGTTFKFTQE